MKKVLCALALFMMLSSCASAALPSVTVLTINGKMKDVLQELESKYPGKLSTSIIDVNEHPEIARRYNVRYVPTLIFKDSAGKTAAVETGYRNADEVVDIFRKKGVKL